MASRHAFDDVKMNLFGKTSISVKTGSIFLRSLVLEGSYPKWERLIPTGMTFNAKIVAGELLSACRQAAIMTDNVVNKIIFDFDDNKLVVSAAKSVYGDSSVEVGVSGTGQLSMAFNPMIWLDFLAQLEADSVIDFDAGGKSKLALVTQGDYRFIAVPLLSEVK